MLVWGRATGAFFFGKHRMLREVPVMNNGVHGLVNGVAWYPDRMLLRFRRPCYAAVCSDVLLETFCSGTLLAVPENPEAYRLSAGEAGYVHVSETPCAVLRLFGVAVVGGGVLHEILSVFRKEAVCPLAVSASEEGAAFVLKCSELTLCRGLLLDFISD